jgi:hypothetical protein
VPLIPREVVSENFDSQKEDVKMLGGEEEGSGREGEVKYTEMMNDMSFNN